MDDDLARFLNARLDDDERYARTMIEVGERNAAKATPKDFADAGALAITVLSDPQAREELERWLDGGILPPNDLKRVLREVAAKRRVLEMYAEQDGYDLPEGVNDGRDPNERECDDVAQATLEGVVCVLAAVYSDHPDYRAEWKF